MIISDVDKKVIGTVLDTLSAGMKRAETETPDGRKVTGYYVTDKQGSFRFWLKDTGQRCILLANGDVREVECLLSFTDTNSRFVDSRNCLTRLFSTSGFGLHLLHSVSLFTNRLSLIDWRH